MNSFELYLKDGRSAGVFACGECRIVHREEATANRCCQPRSCDKCGIEVGRPYGTRCNECSKKAEAEREADRFKSAEKVDSWSGWVWDGADFYQGIEELTDTYEDDGTPLPEYVWTCDPVRFVLFSIDEVKDQIMNSDEAYEDFDANDLNGLDELEKAIDAFNTANENVVSYQVNHRRALILTPTHQLQ